MAVGKSLSGVGKLTESVHENSNKLLQTLREEPTKLTDKEVWKKKKNEATEVISKTGEDIYDILAFYGKTLNHKYTGATGYEARLAGVKNSVY
jgi:hypothetical protein